MLGGRQRRMFYVKDTKSKLFCEAYFILKDSADMSCVAENDLAAEADRILRERFPERNKKHKPPHLKTVAAFALGLAAGIALMLLTL